MRKHGFVAASVLVCGITFSLTGQSAPPAGVSAAAGNAVPLQFFSSNGRVVGRVAPSGNAVVVGLGGQFAALRVRAYGFGTAAWDDTKAEFDPSMRYYLSADCTGAAFGSAQVHVLGMSPAFAVPTDSGGMLIYRALGSTQNILALSRDLWGYGCLPYIDGGQELTVYQLSPDPIDVSQIFVPPFALR